MPLIIVAAGVLVLLVLILFKVKPLYALPIVSILVGLAQGLPLLQAFQSVATGFWDTTKSIALVVGLGAMLGKMIEISGAAHQITNSLIGWFGQKNLQWAVMLTGLIVGIPLFYNAGFVILVPLVFSIAYTARVSTLLVGIPMAASLSVTHGFLPPHPGPTAIASIFHADLNLTLFYGLAITIPAVILAGPVFSKSLKGIQVGSVKKNIADDIVYRPPVGLSFFIALLPVAIIALAGFLSWKIPSTTKFFVVVGHPAAAIGIALLLALYFFAFKVGRSLQHVSRDLNAALKEIAVILLVIAAGGGFKQVLIDSGVGIYIKEISKDLTMSPLLLAWSITALLRVSLGSATVAGLTAAGIVAPFASQAGVQPELLVLSVGAGSLFFSHVNDTGFWMFKEYFNLTLKQTFLSWTMMESIISIVGLLGVLLLDKIT